MSSALLIVYLAGAIATAWCLNAPTANRDRRAFFTMPCLIWPITVTVFGILVLIALLAHWYDRSAAAFTDRRADVQDDPSKHRYPLCPLPGHLKPSHVRRYTRSLDGDGSHVSVAGLKSFQRPIRHRRSAERPAAPAEGKHRNWRGRWTGHGQAL